LLIQLDSSVSLVCLQQAAVAQADILILKQQFVPKELGSHYMASCPCWVSLPSVPLLDHFLSPS